MICTEEHNPAEYNNFFDFANHVVNDHTKHPLMDWAERVVKSEDYKNWKQQ